MYVAMLALNLIPHVRVRSRPWNKFVLLGDPVIFRTGGGTGIEILKLCLGDCIVSNIRDEKRLSKV